LSRGLDLDPVALPCPDFDFVSCIELAEDPIVLPGTAAEIEAIRTHGIRLHVGGMNPHGNCGGQLDPGP
jgi:hypothetical protein